MRVPKFAKYALWAWLAACVVVGHWRANESRPAVLQCKERVTAYGERSYYYETVED